MNGIIKKSCVYCIYIMLLIVSAYSCSTDNMKDSNINSEIQKIIIYVDDEVCETVIEFYHDVLKLPFKYEPESHNWVEFNTGYCSLCIHHNNKSPKSYEGGIAHFVLTLESNEKVEAMHKKFISDGYQVKYIFDAKERQIISGQISEVFYRESTEGNMLAIFWISDPVGNIVQIEPSYR